MTLSARKFYMAAAFLLVSTAAISATPPDAEMAAAGSAIARAERVQPRGMAGDVLADARGRFAQAQEAMAKHRYKDALSLAQEAQAIADRAFARARLDNARAEVEEKSARNEALRRQLLVVPEHQP